jgi:tetratricopeptide (TPR) repeat protein
MGRWLSSLLLAAFTFSSPAWAGWREASSKHFVIYSEQSAKTVQKFAEGLERYDKALRFLFHVPDEQVSHASRVTVFIVPNIGTVQRLYGAKSTSGIAGFYHDWPAGPVAFVPRSTGDEEFGFDNTLVLQHEYAHHFMYQNYATVFPAWFSEGFAEFAATAQRMPDGAVNLGMAANHRAYGLLLETPLPIDKLLEKAPEGKSDDMDKFYGRSWLLCHYLIVDPARQGPLLTYIQALNSGKPNLEAARAAFGDLKQLDRDLNAYLRRIQSKMMGFKLPSNLIPIGPVSTRELGSGESAIMEARIRSKAGVTKDTAPGVVALARTAAAPYPKDAAVQTALAEAEFDAGNYAESEAAADRATAADPKAVDALTYKGIAMMRRAMSADKYDADTWREIRRTLAVANRLDPDDPEPLTYFFYSYLRQGVPPSDNAVMGAGRALDLAPQDTGLRMTLIQYFLSHGKNAEARKALLWLASDPHHEKLRQAAAAMIAGLDSGGPDAALGVLRTRQSDIEEDDNGTGAGS